VGTDAGDLHADDENVLRKLIVFGLVVAATLIAVPVMLGALRSQSAFAAPFSQGGLTTRGWSSRQSVDAQRLRVGVPVSQRLTIENAGSLPANFSLTAEVTGDHQFASHLWVVATRTGDGATVFSGPVTGLRAISLGRFNEHTRETLRLQVTLAGLRGSDNALQGRHASVAFNWTATQI
jgi:hypothetical protein